MTEAVRLAYGTNVVPAERPASLAESLATLWSDVRARVAPGGRLGLGLWLPDDVARPLARDAAAMRALREVLDGHRLDLVTVNAFPARAFHAPVVKEQVYRPAWTEPERFAHTCAAARAVAGIVAPGSDVTISTLPLGHPKLAMPEQLRAAGLLLATVLELHRIREATGTTIRLALEPEPTCALETVDETIEFFGAAVRPFVGSMAGAAGLSEESAREIVDRHLGVCLDLCHAAVEHEDPVASLERYDAAEVPVHKVQVSAAVEVPDPADPAQREALAAFVEPRWLHQVGAPGVRGGGTATTATTAARVVRDLPDALADAEFAQAAPWRVHFHVPVHLAEVGGLPTTRPAVERFLAVVRDLPDPPVLEIETYTWSVVPGAAEDLAANVAAEFAWVRALTVPDPDSPLSARRDPRRPEW
jgi:sugar phosphate isomerase/epimerase